MLAGAGLFRPSRPDFIETKLRQFLGDHDPGLFRPSRPDFIETSTPWASHFSSRRWIVPAF